MIEQSIIERVKKSIDELNTMCVSFMEKKQEYATLMDRQKALEIEKKGVEEKQKKQDKFLEVVLRVEHKTTEVDEMSKELEQIINQLKRLSDELDNARTDILKKFKDLPFPIDPQSSSVLGSVTKFKMIKDINFKKESLQILCELLELSYPLSFEGVTYYPDEISVNAASMDEAMNQVVQSINSLRFKIGDLLSAYSNIDELCERVRSSDRYSPILKALFVSNRPLSVGEIAQQIGLNENITYQACYNMLRDRWSPNPIKKTSDGKFSLTTTGEITMKRYSEKYGFSLSRTQRELKEVWEKTIPLSKE